MASALANDYPAQFDVEYAEQRDRLNVFFRLVLVIPIAILSALVTAAAQNLAFAIALMLLFRNRYPRVWFDWYLYINQFTNRVNAYAMLLVDEYPSTTDQQRVTTTAQLEEGTLSRWLPLVKWFLAIPHYIVLALLFTVLGIVLFLAWLIILVTGRFPRGMFDFVVGIFRWSWRVNAYMALLSTDRYPPFSLK
ncbi:MAG: DUF4389 domain-containing protein [Hyphomicrobiaceae bacterium]|nr:DUF4389 domain-containing protein [Hyphomicrobiaceae bacterium]MCB9483342.1 DUF4389 domain-containing protein [Dehalococcoidia bacterium]MCB9492160.1 DUF4389 domain-containing protein [Dehalococcoidia bacterium]